MIPVLLKVGDDLSTDGILPAGSEVLPYRSNIPKIADFVFRGVDPEYVPRARAHQGQHAIVAGTNYGQGSSREHAVLAPRYLGLQVVIARSFARIHWQNLVNFGVLPLTFVDDDGYDKLSAGATLVIEGIHDAVRSGADVIVRVGDAEVRTRHALSERQVDVVLAGGQIPWFAARGA